MLILRICLITAAICAWVGIYIIFFNKQWMRWIKERPQRKAKAAAEAKRKAEEVARLADELAAKYPLPPSVKPPQQ